MTAVGKTRMLIKILTTTNLLLKSQTAFSHRDVRLQSVHENESKVKQKNSPRHKTASLALA